MQICKMNKIQNQNYPLLQLLRDNPCKQFQFKHPVTNVRICSKYLNPSLCIWEVRGEESFLKYTRVFCPILKRNYFAGPK